VRQGFQLAAEQQPPEELMRRFRQRQEFQEALRQQVEEKKALKEKQKRQQEEEEAKDLERIQREQAMLQQRYQRNQDMEHNKTEIGGAAGNVSVVGPPPAAIAPPPVAMNGAPAPLPTAAQLRRERAIAAREQQQRMQALNEPEEQKNMQPQRSDSPPVPAARGAYVPQDRVPRVASPPMIPPYADNENDVRNSVDRVSGFNDRSTHLRLQSKVDRNMPTPNEERGHRMLEERPHYEHPLNRESRKSSDSLRKSPVRSAYMHDRGDRSINRRATGGNGSTSRIEEWRKEIDQQQRLIQQQLQEQNKEMQYLRQVALQAVGREVDMRSSLEEELYVRGSRGQKMEFAEAAMYVFLKCFCSGSLCSGNSML